MEPDFEKHWVVPPRDDVSFRMVRHSPDATQRGLRSPTAKAARERTEALQRDVKTTYDEFLALDIDVTTLSTADQLVYAEIMDTLRRQRVPLEYRWRSIIPFGVGSALPVKGAWAEA